MLASINCASLLLSGIIMTILFPSLVDFFQTQTTHMRSIRMIFSNHFSIRFMDVPQVTNLLSFLLSLVPFQFLDVGHFFVNFFLSKTFMLQSNEHWYALFLWNLMDQPTPDRHPDLLGVDEYGHVYWLKK
jgi:hypothetical protein